MILKKLLEKKMPLHNKHSFRCSENQTVECGSGFKRKYLMTDRRIRPKKCAERGLAYPILSPSPPPLPSTSVGPSIQTNFAPVSGTDRGFGSVTIYSCSAIVQGGGGGGGGGGAGGFVYIDRQRLAQVQRGFVLVLHLFTLSFINRQDKPRLTVPCCSTLAFKNHLSLTSTSVLYFTMST